MRRGLGIETWVRRVEDGELRAELRMCLQLVSM
jgi:hypothetical protein